MAYHRLIDDLQEKEREEQLLGITSRGIGVVYINKVALNSIRAIDLADREVLEEKIVNHRGKVLSYRAGQD